MRIRRRDWAVGLLVLASAGCGPIASEARIPDPNILGATKKHPGNYTVDVSSVPEEATCSRQEGLKDFCVTDFRTALGGGVEKVLAAYLDQVKGAPAFRGTFRLIEFSHSVTSGHSQHGGPSAKVTLRWQFELVDGGGTSVIRLAEGTDGPEQISNVHAADKVIQALLNAVMEKIASALDAATWPNGA